ncbi:MAG: TetR/AcrR family transcriptional regulator [Thermodesulfobacteriota bacterium]
MKKPRTPEELETVKAALLDHALDIIVSQGLDDLTMRNLAGRAKMTAPNIYNYYSGKDEIYLSLVVKGFEMLHAALKKAHDGPGDIMARGRAMMEAYIRFGLDHSRYYDIMFVLPTPKYNDFRGTPHEHLSETEYRLSMEIAALAEKTLRKVYGRKASRAVVTRRLIQVWSLLHGMVSLHNSRVASYVADDLPSIYRRTLDEMVGLIKAL